MKLIFQNLKRGWHLLQPVSQKIARLIEKVVTWLAAPVWENLLFLLFMMGIQAVCVWRQIQYNGEATEHFMELWFDLYLLCLLLHFLPRKIAQAGRTLLYIVGYTLAIFEVFLTERFLMLYTPTTIRLWLETNAEETSEFFKAYLKGDALWHTLLWFGLLLLANIVLAFFARCRSIQTAKLWLTQKTPERFSNLLSRWLRFLICLLVVLSFIWVLPTWSREKDKMISFFRQTSSQATEKVRWQTFYTPAYRLVYSFRMLQIAQKDLVVLKKSMREIKIDTCTFRCPQIVLIIGESYNKYHSQLYGYKRPTTPWQLQEWQSGRMVRFGDVVTTWNLTSNVFKNMFSTHSIDQPGTWCDGVLFPALFRKAGYKVAFLTNQYQNIKRQSSVDFNGSFFLNDPDLDTLCFDHRNRMIYRYDKAFIQEYTHYQPTGHDLLIFHLYGQHQKYDYRFTKHDVYFTSDSLRDRKNLRGWRRQMLADYDNATRYNDEVVRRICNYVRKKDAVVIYLADHGEEIFDQSLMYGRTPAEPLIPIVAHYEFEVPMEMWFSETFRNNHPDIVKAAQKAALRPFMSDDLPHLLMGLAGIRCHYYDPRRDLLNDSFNTARKRMVKGLYDFDKVLIGTKFESKKQAALRLTPDKLTKRNKK